MAQYDGTGNVVLPLFDGGGEGNLFPLAYSGTGEVVLPPLGVTGTGTLQPRIHSGSGVATLPNLVVSGSGERLGADYTGEGEATFPVVTTTAYGFLLHDLQTGAVVPGTIAHLFEVIHRRTALLADRLRDEKIATTEADEPLLRILCRTGAVKLATETGRLDASERVPVYPGVPRYELSRSVRAIFAAELDGKPLTHISGSHARINAHFDHGDPCSFGIFAGGFWLNRRPTKHHTLWIHYLLETGMTEPNRPPLLHVGDDAVIMGESAAPWDPELFNIKLGEDLHKEPFEHFRWTDEQPKDNIVRWMPAGLYEVLVAYVLAEWYKGIGLYEHAVPLADEVSQGIESGRYNPLTPKVFRRKPTFF